MSAIKRIDTYVPIYDTEKRYVRLQGGAGSGKSIAVAQYLLLLAMSEQGHRIFAFRKVGRTVKNSIFATFKDLIFDYNLGNVWKINNTLYTLTCIETGVEIICGGVDDPEKVKSIKDPTIIWMEEATEFNYGDFEQLNLRLRKQGIKNQLIISYNPISTDNWIYNRFHVKKELHGQELYIQSTYLDNPFLPDQYINSLQKLAKTNDSAFKVYTLGQWANLTQGLIFPSFTIIDQFPVELNDKAIYGLDFGFVDPMALVKVGLQDNRVFIHLEHYESGQTIEQLTPVMTSAGIKPNDIIYCDSARPGDIQSIYNAGFRGAKPAQKGQGSILSGIRKMHEYEIHVTASSTKLIEELGKYCWMKDKSDNYIEKPIDDFNHAIDAIRYAIFTHTYRPQAKPSFARVKHRGINPYRP